MNTPSLTKKIYPNVLRTRPLLLKLAAISMIAIIISIITILITSIHHKRHPAKFHNESAQILANSNDISWYQQAQNTKPSSAMQSTHTQVPSVGNKPPSQEAKSMLAQPASEPMTSHQLIGAEFYRNTTNSENGNSLAALMPTEQQSAKKTFLQNSDIEQNSNHLLSQIENPQPYSVQTGSIIPALLITGIDSDLPGQITAQVKFSVYDSISGRYLLIPQGSRLIGLYDSEVVYGQQRVLISWRRIIFPNGKSLNLEGMPGVDLSGYSGFHDQVNNHYNKIFGSVILMSILSGGAQLSQPQYPADPNQFPTINQTLAQNLATNISDASTTLLKKNMGISPTLHIRPGYEFNVMVTKDMVFPESYE
jgi:type IV secretory pathway VirB10-like protein